MEFIRHIDHLLYLLTALILTVYYLYFLFPLSRKPTPKFIEGKYPPVSLIIAYKDEHENLKFHLDHWLAQDYPHFEIILVNDHSSDESLDFLAFRKQDRIKLISLAQTSGKKAAIQAGISVASHELMLFTDADCKPMSSEWIKLMIMPMIDGKQIVVGYSGFYPEMNLLNVLQRYENCMNALQNAAMIEKGRAYMAVGRNMAYQRTILKNGDQSASNSILSGDDDLLVNQLSKDGNTAFAGEIDSQTISKAAGSWTTYFFQRRRQLEAGKHYKTSDRIKLGILGSSQLLFNLLFIKQLIQMDYLSIILSIFVVKLILQFIVSYKPMKRIGEMDLWWQAPILEIIYLPIISLIGISQYLYKVDRWK